MNPFSHHSPHSTPSRPGRSFVVLGAVLGALGLLAVPTTAISDDPQPVATTVVSPQYQEPTGDAMASQAAALVDAAEFAVATATVPTEPEALPPTPPPPPPVAAPAQTSESSITDASPNTFPALNLPTPPDATSTYASASGAHDPIGSAPPPAVDVASAAAPAPPAATAVPPDATQPNAGLAPQAVEAAAQTTLSDATAAVVATAGQVAPTNLNVAIRINSPGDDGPVTQSNTVVGSLPGVSAGGAAAESAGTGVSVASTSGTLPTTWVWNWVWSAGGCTSGVSPPPQSAVVGATWTWTWTWGCAPAPPTRLQITDPTVPAPSNAGDGQSGDHVQATTPSARGERIARNPGPSPAVGPHEGVDGPPGSGATERNPFIRVLRGGDSAVQHANATATRASTASGQALIGLSRDSMPPIGVIAPAAAAIASAGPSTNGGLAAAALVAILAFFAPQLLLPLWTASARRPGNVSSRRERPG